MHLILHTPSATGCMNILLGPEALFKEWAPLTLDGNLVLLCLISVQILKLMLVCLPIYQNMQKLLIVFQPSSLLKLLAGQIGLQEGQYLNLTGKLLKVM